MPGANLKAGPYIEKTTTSSEIRLSSADSMKVSPSLRSAAARLGQVVGSFFYENLCPVPLHPRQEKEYINSANSMLNMYAQHPAEDTLERFLSGGSDELECEVVETHVMACASCVSRLETLELEIATMKLALQEMHREQVAKAAAREQRFGWCSWFALPRLPMAGAAVALALGVFVAPPIATQNAPIAKVNLVAYRGLEAPTVPKNHRLQVHLNANDLNQNTVEVQLVDSRGSEVWNATTPVPEGGVDISVPEIGKSGAHFFRIYTRSSNGRGELLREFAFQVK